MAINKNLKVLFFLLFFIVISNSIAQKSETDGIEIMAHRPFNYITDFANFPSCISKEVGDRKICFNKEFSKHMIKKLGVAQDSMSTHFNGKVYFKFLLDTAGAVEKITVFDLTEASQIKLKLETAITALPKMTVAIIDQKKASTEYTMYVEYTLGTPKRYKVIDIKTMAVLTDEEKNTLKDESEDFPFIIVEDVPIFPGCEAISISGRRNCFNQKVQQHIQRNFRYPEEAQKFQIQGKVIISFIINKNGNASNITTRGAHPLLELEARRIFNKLPKMTSGKHRGKPVRVPFAIPLTFRLQ